MLAYLLAILVGSGSVGMYIAAFFVPEIHRKNDFIWSGIGCFYALMLWIYAEQMSGGMLVGQTAGVALLCWLGWETLKLRRQIVPTNQKTPIPSSTELLQKIVDAPQIIKSGSKPPQTKPIETKLPETKSMINSPESSFSEEDNQPEAWIKLEQIPEKLPVEEE